MKKLSTPLRIVVGVFGVVTMVAGIAQVRSGVSEIGGSPSSEVAALLDVIETAVNAANSRGSEAAPLFQELLSSVDSLGLATVHRDRQVMAQTLTDLLAQTAGQFRIAAAMADSAANLERQERRKSFLAARADGYRQFAQSAAINKDIVALVMNESIVTWDVLTPRVLAAAARRDSAQARGTAAQARANAIAKEGVAP